MCPFLIRSFFSFFLNGEVLRGFQLSQEDITIWRNILAITITWGVLFPVFVMEIQYEQLYLKHLGASPFYIGITYAAGIVALSISRLLGGYLADNIGRKKLIYVFTYIVGILFFIPYLIVDWVIVAFTLVIINIFFLFQPAVSALIADSSEARLRGKLYALMNILSLLVTIPAPMIANYLVGLYGLVNGMRLIYLITAIIFLLSGFLRQAMLVETFRMSENKIEFADMLKGYKCTIKFSFNYLKWPLFARIILFSTGFAILNFTGIYVSDILGLGKMYWGEVFFYSNIITVVIVLSLGFLSDKIGRKIPILSSMIFFIPTVALLYLVNPVLEKIFIQLSKMAALR